MAITPRTVFSQPIYFTVLSLASFGVIALVGIILGLQKSPQATPSSHTPVVQKLAPEHTVTRASSHRPETACDRSTPANQWSSAQWARHLDCLQALKAPSRVLLGEVNMAISRVGLKPDLALRKSDYLMAIAPLEQQIDFLRGAVDGLGVVEGKLVHRLRRALIWRGKLSDLEEIQTLEDIERRLKPAERAEQCERGQTNIWAHIMVAKSLENPGIEDEASAIVRGVARQSVQREVRAYVALGCVDQIHEGRRETLAELSGVAIAAEATNEHAGESSLPRKIAASYRILNIPEFCRQAVPAGMDLRQSCEKRVGDELYLAR